MEKIVDYKYALDKSSIISITDQNGIIKYVNDNFCSIFKYSYNELIGQDHRIVNSGYHSKELLSELWATIQNGEIWKGELKNRAKDGELYWVFITIVPFFNEYNKPYKYIAISTDITERKRNEKELKKSLKEVSDYKYALNEAAIVAITNQKGIITHVNDNFCRISKYSYNELIGQDHRIINSGYHTMDFIKNLWHTIANGKVWKGELKNKAKDGTTYWVDTTIVPFLNEAGKPYQYIAIRSDITERKEAEEQIKLNNIKLREYAQILEFKNSQLNDFCNIVSHNLRAPLINISILVDYIEQAENHLIQERGLKNLKPVIKHLTDVFNELVESIQVKQDTEIKKDKIILKECLQNILVVFKAQIAEYEADIQVNLEDAPIIYFPKKYIESILTNLISNALKYKSLDKKPIIKIRTKKQKNGSILLSVEDNGLGIDMIKYKHQIFKNRKIFHKHPQARGFGLYMTKTHVEAMNGKIWVESEPNKGSTFYIEFNNQIK